ncbi:MAG TPA: hypothetical protein VLO07_02405 [Thermoanaerobaculia bacterium]|nr:hypothetical protein [Thermoanaerobaculia bacterium]
MASRRMVGGSVAALLLGCLMAPVDASAGQSEEAILVSDRAGDAYVLSRGGHWSSTNESLEALRGVQRRFSGEFLWVRRAGKQYLIRDRRTLDEAQTLFAPLRRLDPERAALRPRQARLERQQAAMDREQEKLERELDGLADDPEARDQGPARRRLERRQRELETRMHALEQEERELEAVERSIDEREDDLEKRAEAELWLLIDRSISSADARPIA